MSTGPRKNGISFRRRSQRELAMAHGVAVPVSSTELARGPHSSHRVYNATMVLLYYRPRHLIAESGTQTRARPKRSRWLETGLFPAMAVNCQLP